MKRLFTIFGFSFARPRTIPDWCSFGAFTAFLAALFTEMDLLAGWLQRHDVGHRWETLRGWRHATRRQRA